MYNYDVSNYMQKHFAPNDGVPGGGAGEKPRKPRTRLSKWLAKIAGVYDGEMEPKTEAEYYLNEIAENGVAGGGGVPEANEKGLVLTTGTKGDKIAIIDTHITTPMLSSDEDPYKGTWAGFDESLIKWPEDDGAVSTIKGTVNGYDSDYDIFGAIDLNGNVTGHYISTHWGGHGFIKFFPDGTFEALVDGGKGGQTVFDALDSDFFLDIDKIEPVWADMPKGTVTATASMEFVSNNTDSTLDMTAEEIMTALGNGPVFVQHHSYVMRQQVHQYGIVMRMDTGREGTPYYFRVLTYYNGAPIEAVFTASSRADHPVCTGT